MVHYYEELKVWQKSVNFVTEVYKYTASFPKEEAYGLTSQIRRAAVSIPSNIAEGSSRETTRDFLRFLSISNGSLAELQTQFIIAKNLGFISLENLAILKESADEVGRMIHGLQKSLQKKLVSSTHLPLTTNNLPLEAL